MQVKTSPANEFVSIIRLCSTDYDCDVKTWNSENVVKFYELAYRHCIFQVAHVMLIAHIDLFRLISLIFLSVDILISHEPRVRSVK